jgi:hypothetical protein
MNFRDIEKKRAPDIIENVIGGKGNGLYANRRYPFVLQDRTQNLWDQIRNDALDYFERYSIIWWSDDSRNIPTGHVLSSQVACINHLFWLRDRKDAALSVAKRIDPDIVDVEKMDSGYVEFEVIGKRNYLGERSHERGANATAFDAAMVGVKRNSKKLFIAIEWKYTESYGKDCKYKPARAEIYDPLMDREGSPIQVDNKEAVYYEPYYQLMRQTLLAWKIVNAKEDDGYDDYTHVHVIPDGNKQLVDVNRSPNLPKDNLKDAWKSVLVEPEKYNIIDPKELLRPVLNLRGTETILLYLSSRYW